MTAALRRLPLPASPAGRAAVFAGMVVAVLLLASVILDAIFPSPHGPGSSSYSTAPDGFAAWSELLRKNGHDVSALRSSPTTSNLPDRGTVIVLDPDTLEVKESKALRAFMRSGGTVLAGGRRQDAWVRTLAGDQKLAFQPTGNQTTHPYVPATELSGVVTVSGADGGSWSNAGGMLPLLGAGDEPLLIAKHVGDGRLLLLADAAPLQNARLRDADNAAFALGLGGKKEAPVTFVEAKHGFGNQTGLAALPARAKVAAILALLGVLLLYVARGRRFGPAERKTRDLAPPRSAYVDALSTSLARTKLHDEAVKPVRAAARAHLARSGGLGPDPDTAALRAAAQKRGLSDHEIDVLLGTAEGDEDVLALGRALAQLETQPRERV